MCFLFEIVIENEPCMDDSVFHQSAQWENIMAMDPEHILEMLA
jgi:hypothetical protein